MMVRKNIILLLGIVFLCFSEPYTLEQLIDSGFENSREIKMVEEEISKADAQIWEYKAKAFPVIDFSANYQYALKQYSPLSFGNMGSGMSITQLLAQNGITPDSEPGEYIIAGAFDALMQGMSEASKPKKNLVSLGLTLQQPLFAQGKVSIGLKIATIYSRSLLCKLQDKQMAVKADITKLFYAALLAQNNETVKQNAVNLAQEAHKIATARFSYGKGTELDTLNTRLFLVKSEMEYQDAQKQRKMALDALIKKTGISAPLEEFHISGDFPRIDYNIELEQAFQRLHKENKKIIQLNAAEEIQKHQVKLVKSDYYPIVYCGGSINKISQFNADDNDIAWHNDQKLFVGINYTLFSAGQRYQRIRQTQSDLRSFQQVKAQTVEQLELATRNVWEELQTARKRLALTQSVLTMAEKGHIISKKAYEVGQITLYDFQKSEQELNDAHVKFNGALFAFHSTVVDMKLLLAEYTID